MAGDYGFYVTHTAIAQFKSVPVEDFVEWVEFRRMVFNKGREAFTDFGSYIFTAWRVKPRCVPLVISSRFWYIRKCLFV